MRPRVVAGLCVRTDVLQSALWTNNGVKGSIKLRQECYSITTGATTPKSDWTPIRELTGETRMCGWVGSKEKTTWQQGLDTSLKDREGTRSGALLAPSPKGEPSEEMFAVRLAL